jgi:hypothetical protein
VVFFVDYSAEACLCGFDFAVDALGFADFGVFDSVFYVVSDVHVNLGSLAVIIIVL